MSNLVGKFNTMIDDPHKGARLASKVAEAERALEETKGKWDDISTSLATEALAFHRVTNADFARGLKAHAHQQIDFEAQQQQHWKELLAVFEQVPDAEQL